MRGRLWVVILYAGLGNASAFAQADLGGSARPAGEGSAATIPLTLPAARPPLLQRDVERTNLGWVVLLGLHSLTAPASIRAQPRQVERP